MFGERGLQDDIDLNTILIADLLDLKAVEAAPLIEQAFAAENVDELMVDTWAAIHVELGLKQETDFSPEALKPKIPPEMAEMRQLLAQLDADHKPLGFGTTKPQTAKQGKKKKKK